MVSSRPIIIIIIIIIIIWLSALLSASYDLSSGFYSKSRVRESRDDMHSMKLGFFLGGAGYLLFYFFVGEG